MTKRFIFISVGFCSDEKKMLDVTELIQFYTNFTYYITVLTESLGLCLDKIQRVHQPSLSKIGLKVIGSFKLL